MTHVTGETHIIQASGIKPQLWREVARGDYPNFAQRSIPIFARTNVGAGPLSGCSIAPQIALGRFGFAEANAEADKAISMSQHHLLDSTGFVPNVLTARFSGMNVRVIPASAAS
jgi:hypothetical protein